MDIKRDFGDLGLLVATSDAAVALVLYTVCGAGNRTIKSVYRPARPTNVIAA